METRSPRLCNRCISTELDTQIPACFSPILLDSKSSQQNNQGKSSKAWTRKVWYPKILNMLIKSPILLPWRKDLLKNPKGEIHFLVQNRTLQLVVLKIFGLDCRRREFKRHLPTLSSGQEDQILMQIMNQLGESGLAGVLEGKLISFLVT